MVRLGRGFPNHVVGQLQQRFRGAPVFDQAGPTPTSGSNVTFTHPAGGSNRAILLYMVSFGTISGSATCAGATMAPLLAAPLNIGVDHSFGNNLYLGVYGILGQSSTSKSIVTPSSATGASYTTVSYTGVSAFGTPTTAVGSGTADAITAGAPANYRLSQCFGNTYNVTSYNQTQRAYTPGGGAPANLVGDALGGTQTFTGTQSTSDVWGGVVVPLQP